MFKIDLVSNKGDKKSLIIDCQDYNEALVEMHNWINNEILYVPDKTWHNVTKGTGQFDGHFILVK